MYKKNIKKDKKNEENFICEICNYKTKKKSNYQKHMNTNKHIQNMKHISSFKNKYKNTVTPEFVCEFCNKIYKFKSGLSRHRKICYEKDESMNNHGYYNHSNNYNKYCGDNNEIIKLLLEQQKTQTEQTNNALKLVKESLNEMGKMVPKIGNNNNNTNKISINVFLNEKCKDAMNMTNFIQNIQVSLDDLMYTKDNGYVKGITHILTKKLNDLKPNERPIHCSDKKRLQFYIKDNDVWDKTESQEKLDNTIRDMEREQIQKLSEWEKLNPNYLKDEKLLNEWQKIIHQIMDGASEATKRKNRKIIKKNIAEYVEIKEDLHN